MGNASATLVGAAYFMRRRGVRMCSYSLGDSQGRQSASAMGQSLLLGYGRRRIHGADFVICATGLLPRYGCGLQFLLGLRGVSHSLLEGHVQRCAAKGSGLAGRSSDGAVEFAAVPLGISAARLDASGS